ncbi:MAG: AraC family transcriptional regulator [Pseudomonadales bacterium]
MERFFNSIQFMEQHLYAAITLEDIAASAHYSSYHYSRMFRAIVGDSPVEYLRKRRLTVAAERLLRTQDAILAIALDCQFESQAAFSRAFKQYLNLSPGQYRRCADPYRLLYREQFSAHTLSHLDQISLEPRIESRGPLKTVGVVNRYTHEDLNLSLLWSAFMPMASQIPNRVGKSFFGLYENYRENGASHTTEVAFSYVCSVEVEDFSEVPDTMVIREIPAQLYAVFEHRAPLSELPATLAYIWGSWLPKSRYDYLERPDFELYPPQKITPDNPTRVIELHIPIVER